MSSDAITVNAVLAAAGDWKELASRGDRRLRRVAPLEQGNGPSPGHRRR